MPLTALRTMAKRAGKSFTKDAERYWDQAKADTVKNKPELKGVHKWKYVMGIVRKRLGGPYKKHEAEIDQFCEDKYMFEMRNDNFSGKLINEAQEMLEAYSATDWNDFLMDMAEELNVSTPEVSSAMTDLFLVTAVAGKASVKRVYQAAVASLKSDRAGVFNMVKAAWPQRAVLKQRADEIRRQRNEIALMKSLMDMAKMIDRLNSI